MFSVEELTGNLNGALVMFRTGPDMAVQILGATIIPLTATVLSAGVFNEALQLTALEILACAASTKEGRTLIETQGVLPTLRSLQNSLDAPGPVRRSATSLVAHVSGRGSAAPSSTPAPPSLGGGAGAGAKRALAPGGTDLRSVKLSLEGCLAGCDRKTEDGYIRCLLLIDGVTSVTLDRKAESCTAYYSFGHVAAWDEDEASVAKNLRSKLYGVLQRTCDEARDSAGRPRVTLNTQGTGYLDEEDVCVGGGKENAGGSADGWGVGKPSDDDPFCGTLVDMGTGVTDRSAADRLRAKQGNAGGGGGWMSSWLGW